MKNSGNTILITGGTAGIGLEVVRQFYQINNRLIVTSSNAENLEKLKRNFPNIQTYNTIMIGKQRLRASRK